MLGRIDEAPITDALKAQYKGEARTLRALAYFSLLTLYAKPFADGNGNTPGLPLLLVAEYSTGNNSMPRSTVAQVYTQILDDLNFAETNLPLNYLSPYTTVESIFSMPFTTLDLPGTQNGLANYYMPGPVGALDYTLNNTGIIANPGWKTNDARRAFIGTSGASTVWRKFPSNPHTDYVPVIRYAEVLLNLAEARVRQTNTVDARAVDLLNAVRGRSDNTTTFTVGQFATAADLLTQIGIERRIELLGEGLRNFDIMRNLQTFPSKGTAPVVPATASVYVWPIPQSELFSNPEASQNPGY